MKKIAITGGIGSGKSFALNCLRDLGYPTFSCDEIYKEIICSPVYILEIEKNFPTCVNDGVIDRKALSQIVFADSHARQKLNEIAHPLIMQTLLERMGKTQAEFVFAEVPLLFEGNFENLFDGVVIVNREIKERVGAVCARDNLAEQEVLDRINAQIDYHSLMASNRLKNDNVFILENKGDSLSLKNNILAIINSLKK